MPVVGFHLKKISVERKEPITSQINIKTNMKITDITEEKTIVEIAKEGVALQFNFDFTINYEPKVATIHFSGHVLNIEKEEEAKEILKAWKDKKLDEELRLRISNMIWVKCNIKAFLLEEEIGLPIHIPLPRLTK